MAGEPNQERGLDIQGLSIRDVVGATQRLSLGSIAWILGLTFTSVAGIWGGGVWWGSQIRAQSEGALVVPPASVRQVNELPSNSPEGTELLKDISVFDLRSWVPVPPRDRERRVSPVNYINYLHIRKTHNISSYVIHYGTAGYAIDLRCVTHECSVLQREPSPQHLGQKEYAVAVDVSNEAVGKEFLIVIEATYWNGFGDAANESASTYTDHDIGPLGELALIVLFPESKPFKEYRLLEGGDNANTPRVYRGSHSLYPDVNKRFVYWSIQERKPDQHYRLEWTW